jgi:filamentous hemagglutinin
MVKPTQERLGEGKVVWLETGNSGAGWKHILQRHETDFYGLSTISTKKEIKETIYKTIKNGDTGPNEGGGTVYEYAISSDKAIRVAVSDNGFVLTAHPIKI